MLLSAPEPRKLSSPLLSALFILGTLLSGEVFIQEASAAPSEKAVQRSTQCTLLLNSGASAKNSLHAYPLAKGANLEKSVLLDDIPVKNQKSYGCCWISSVHARYERETQKKFGRVIPLSDNYHILMSLFYRVEEAIYFGNDISEGGWSFAADWMARNIGLVPESAWQPKLDFLKGEGDGLIRDIEDRLASLGRVLSRMKEKGVPPEEAWEIAEGAKSEFFSLLREKVGNPPSRFTVNGKSYTPHSFAQELFPADKEISIVSISPERPPREVPTAKKNKDVDSRLALFEAFPETIAFLPKGSNKINPANGEIDPKLYTLYWRSNRMPQHITLQRSMKDTHLSVIGALIEGNGVYISTPMMRDYYDKASGVMSISAKGVTVEEAQKAARSGGHAMLITGAYADAQNALIGYRIQNSWGTDVGENGYFFMDKDYFEAFVDKVRVQIQADPE
jgi:aminopeptidase C